MRSKTSLLLLISLCLLLVFSGQVFGARYLIVAPGQTWTNGVGIIGSLENQVAGVPFNVSVVAVNDATTAAFDSSGFSVTMTCSVQSTILPANTFQLNQNLNATPNALRYPVTVTFGPAVATNAVISANPNGSGPTVGSVTITSQVIGHFHFSAISSPKTAGQAFYISVSAHTAAEGLVTGFDGTATLTANYPVIGAVTVGTIQFTNGAYYGPVILYDATEANLTLACTSTTPAATGTSAAFSVSAAALNKLVIIGPGQTFAPGINGGNGRVSNSTTMSQRTAGAPFSVDVYAVDAYNNTCTTATTITMSTTDPNFVFTPASSGTSGAPNFGRATFLVELRSVGTGTQTLTATAPGITAGQDIAPMTYAALHHFNLSQTIPLQTAGEPFGVSASAVDQYNNTVTSYNLTPAVDYFDGTTPLAPDHTGIQISSFTGGVGFFTATIFQRVLNANIRLTDGVTGTTNSFVVSPNVFAKLLFVAPGQTTDPGDELNRGVSGSPDQAVAGIPYIIAVYATDAWGNQIGTINDVVSLTTSDSAAMINLVTPPASVTLSNGFNTYSVIFKTGGTNTVTGNDTTTGFIIDAVATIFVESTDLSYFEVANVPVSTIAGSTFPSLIVRAKDQFGNNKEDFSGVVFLSANTDYALPYESTMAVTGTNTGAYYHKWAVTFTAGDFGERVLAGALRRSTTYTAKIFASDIFNDTPEVNSGHTGMSGNCTVNPGTAVKMQVIPPGVEKRPGTYDGENNTPTGQFINTNFSCSVSMVDTWWNIVTGSTDEIRITSSEPGFSYVNDIRINLTPQSVYLNSFTGIATFNARYSTNNSAFTINASNFSTGGIDPDTSAYVSIFDIFSISIKAPGGGDFAMQTVGVAFPISITAYKAFGQIADGFNGTMILGASTDYSESEQTIDRTVSVTFTAGIAVMNITMYRAWTNATKGSGAYLKASFASIQGSSNTFDITWGVPEQTLILTNGMAHKPGLVGIPNYAGYTGSPSTVEAGVASSLDVLYVDYYYNVVYAYPNTYTAYSTYAKITSIDPLASINGVNLSTNNVYLTITAGTFHTGAGMVLRTVGPSGLQTIRVETGITGIANFTSPDIKVKHTTFDHFHVSAPPGPVVAGVPFSIALQAVDLYNNICGEVNGGSPFNNPATLSANTGTNTMWPTTYPMSMGEAIASVQLFKAPVVNAVITADYAGNSGVSATIITAPNEFKRLLVTSAGMSRIPGEFTSAPPTEFNMYNILRPPFYPTNQVVVNDAAHNTFGTLFQVLSCDAYGNLTITPDVIGHTITVTTNDPHAVPITLTAIDSTNGTAEVYIKFHRAAPGMYVRADITRPQISNFTTPTFTTLAGDPFGLQVLVPGITIDPGAGYNDAGGWYNAMVGTPQTQLTGSYFAVTLQSSDVFGNFVGATPRTVRLNSSSPISTPGSAFANYFFGNLGVPDAGISTMTAQLFTSGGPTDIILTPRDMHLTAALNPPWRDPYPSIRVTNGGNLEYRVMASPNTYTAYTLFGDSTNSINAIAAPEKFRFRVNVVDPLAETQPVFGVTNNFALAAVAYPDWNVTIGGALGIQQGTSSNGIFETVNQSYTNATSFRIRVTDLNPTLIDRLDTAYSPIIIMGANPNAVTLTVGVRNASGFHTDIFNTRADTRTVVTGRLVDGNGNNLNGPVVTFRVMSGSGRFAGNNITATAATANGDASVDFYGAFTNENNILQASYNGYYDYVTIAVSIVEPVLGQVSNYPNPFRAGEESTSISYLLNADSDVKIKIYTLFGDLVYSRDITGGSAGAVGGVVNNFIWDGKNNKGAVIGNGGYICVVETTIDGEKKKMIRKIAVSK